MFCNKCGNQVKDGAAFCQKCGNHIVSNTANTLEEIKPFIPASAQADAGIIEKYKRPIVIIAIFLLAAVIIYSVFSNTQTSQRLSAALTPGNLANGEYVLSGTYEYEGFIGQPFLCAGVDRISFKSKNQLSHSTTLIYPDGESNIASHMDSYNFFLSGYADLELIINIDHLFDVPGILYFRGNHLAVVTEDSITIDDRKHIKTSD